VVLACVISPDSGFVATASKDYTCKIWDTATGGGRANLIGHTRQVTARDGRERLSDRSGRDQMRLDHLDGDRPRRMSPRSLLRLPRGVGAQAGLARPGGRLSATRLRGAHAGQPICDQTQSVELATVPYLEQCEALANRLQLKREDLRRGPRPRVRRRATGSH
jgi:hypothetical protein